MDGGKRQVSIIRATLDDMGIDIPVYGLYKDDKHGTKGICSDSELFEVDKEVSCIVCAGIQDEVHRFAIDYHRSLRLKKNFSNLRSQ